MFNRHESCRVTLEDGSKTCQCDCGDKHGINYKPGDLDTPIHLLFRKVAEAYKRGETFSDSESFKEETTAIELSYKREPMPVVEEVDDTLEELEKKRD